MWYVHYQLSGEVVHSKQDACCQLSVILSQTWVRHDIDMTKGGGRGEKLMKLVDNGTAAPIVTLVSQLPTRQGEELLRISALSHILWNGVSKVMVIDNCFPSPGDVITSFSNRMVS